MHVKCIGGPNDGRMLYLNDDTIIGETIRVRYPFPKLVDYQIDPNEIPKAVTMSYEYYLLERIEWMHDKHSPSEYIYFLRHHSFTKWQAIKHQFRK